MARSETITAPPTLTEQIERAIADLRSRHAEVRRLDKESTELASSDVERSIELDLRARAIERFCTRQKAILEELIRKRHQEQFSQYVARLNAIVAAKKEHVREVAEKLNAACLELNSAAIKVASIETQGLSGRDLLKFSPSPTATGHHPFEGPIANALAFRLGSLDRAAWDIRAHAADKNFYPRNLVDGITFSELRVALGQDLRLDAFEIDEPEPVDLMAEIAGRRTN